MEKDNIKIKNKSMENKQLYKKYKYYIENIIMLFLIIICFSIIISIIYIMWTVYKKGHFYFKIEI